jgi:hypothetical protein
VSEAKRNCGRATDRGEEAWSEEIGPMYKNRIEGASGWGERANDREAPMAKTRTCRSGGRVSKVDALTWGDLALDLKESRRLQRSEESAEAVVAVTKPRKNAEVFIASEGPNERTGGHRPTRGRIAPEDSATRNRARDRG